MPVDIRKLHSVTISLQCKYIVDIIVVLRYELYI